MTNEDNNIQNHNFDILKENIERLRKENGWSQKELGEKIGLEQSNISKCLSGGRCFTLEQVWRLADLFEVSIDELLGRSVHNTHSEEKICAFIADLILHNEITPCNVTVNENVWVENEEYEETGQAFCCSTSKNTYFAFYFSNYDQIPSYFDEHEASELFSYYDAAGNDNDRHKIINKFLNLFIDTFKKYKDRILTKDQFDLLTKCYYENLHEECNAYNRKIAKNRINLGEKIPECKTYGRV